MREKAVLMAVLVLAVLISMGGRVAGNPALAESTTGQAANDLRLATFVVPDLSANVAKEISKALANEPGVLSAQADFDRRELSVTYELAQTTLEKVQGIVATVSHKARVEKVEPVPASGGRPACRRCPNRARCGNQK